MVTTLLLKREVEVETEMTQNIHIDVNDEVDDSDIDADENEVHETQTMHDMVVIHYIEHDDNDDL